MSKYTISDYMSRLTLSERLYHQLEDQVLDFLDYVPFDFQHLDVYSHRLITIILEAGPEILSAFDLSIYFETYSGNIDERVMQAREKLLEKENRLKKRKRSLSFKDYYDFLNTQFKTKLSQATIGIYGFNAYIMPFKQLNSDWWESYNELRHDKYSSLRQANLRNTLKTLGALFWLVNANNQRSAIMEEELTSSDLFYDSSPSDIKDKTKL